MSVESLSSRKFSPTRWGLVSLSAAILAWVSWPLVIVVGVAITLGVTLPLLVVATLSGGVAIISGIVYRQGRAVALGAVGVMLVAGGIWSLISAMHF